MGAQLFLPPLFLVQSHSLSQNILPLSSGWPLPDRPLKSLSPPPLSLFPFSNSAISLSILIINQGDQTVNQSQMVPFGGAGWLKRPVDGKTESRPRFKSQSMSPEGAPTFNLRLVPQPQPQDWREGCLQAHPGGWTDGKELASWPRKANSFLELLHEGTESKEKWQKSRYIWGYW